MKPIPPAVVTAVAVSAAVAQNNAIRAGDSATPRDWDSISPRANTFKLRAPATASPPAARQMQSAASEKGANDKSPISQNSMPRNRVSSPKASIKLTTAVQPAATTTPLSNSRCGVQPPRAWASANTNRVAPRAPAPAAQSTIQPPKPNNIAPKAATAAPPEMPST